MEATKECTVKVAVTEDHPDVTNFTDVNTGASGCNVKEARGMVVAAVTVLLVRVGVRRGYLSTSRLIPRYI